MPVNPMTGAPNTRTGNVADVAASLDATPTGSSAPSPKDAPRADEGSFGAHVASMPPASAVRNSTSSPVGDRTFTTYNDSMDELLAKMRNILDSRLLSIVVLVLISFSVVAGENFPAFLIVVVVGYMLIDRFITARRAVTLGGLAWFIVLFLGRLFTMGAGRLFIDLDYLFMFCGFLLALAVCGVFFAGRAMYYMGYDRGQALADRAIAAHLVDRLIEHPENVANLDGTLDRKSVV